MIDQEPSMRGFAKEVVKEVARLRRSRVVPITCAATAATLFAMTEPGDPSDNPLRLAAAGFIAAPIALLVLSTIATDHVKEWARQERLRLDKKALDSFRGYP